MSQRKQRKQSKELILYSVLLSEFERQDFKDDALAGVRANYFNAKCAPQTDKTEVAIGGKPHSLSYSMHKGEPLAWKISCGGEPVQTVKRAADGSYCVISYSGSVVFKRQFFDSAHTWLRTEYYSRALENRIAAVVYPHRADGSFLLRIQRFQPEGVETEELYPSDEKPVRRCAALVYSNSGMIWYDARFKPGQAWEPLRQSEGFRFTKESFRSARVADRLDLQHAPYLREKDIGAPQEKPQPVREEPKPVQTEPSFEEKEPGTYSAYEQIERILMEAHKTNKNLFGMLASQKFVQDEPEAEVISVEENSIEENKDRDNSTEELSFENQTEPVSTVPAEESAPDATVATKNGDYIYFGELDDNGQRTGRGRTVTPDGLTAYEGGYLGDKREGFGVCYYKEGSPNYIGDWHEGSRSGRGVGFRLSDGTIHAGKWQDNKPDGFGARFDREGNFLDVCTYVDGKRNGKSVAFDSDGNIIVTHWKDGAAVTEKIISD